NAINVRSTLAAAARTDIQAGSGNDTFTVSTAPDGSGTLEFLAGPLFLNAGGGANTGSVSDAGNPVVTAYTVLTQATIDRPDGTAPIVYFASNGGTLGQVLFRTGQGSDLVNVRSTLATTAQTRIETGGGADSITVSTAPDGSGTLAFLAGPLFLDAGGGS